MAVQDPVTGRDGSGRALRRGGAFSSALPPKTSLGFAAATLALFLISFLSYQSLQSRTESARRMAQTLELTRQLAALQSTMKDAETGQRGFLLTGEEPFLEPYLTAVGALPGELAALRSAIDPGSPQHGRLERLEQLTAHKMSELLQSIELRRTGRPSAGADLRRAERGKEIMDQIRQLSAEMSEEERRVLEERSRAWERSVELSAAVTWGGTGVLLFLVIAAALMSSRDFREQRIQQWLQLGQTELARRMQGELDVRRLADQIASFLAGYVDAQLAAIYYTETPGQLQRVGAYALPTPQTDDRSPAGLTQQVFQERTLLCIQDIPVAHLPLPEGLGRRVRDRGRGLLARDSVRGGGSPGAHADLRHRHQPREPAHGGGRHL